MSFNTSSSSITQFALLSAFLVGSLTACGSGSSSDPLVEPPIVKPIEGIPTNTIIQASFRDQDGDTGKLAGTVALTTFAANQGNIVVDSLWLYWADEQGEKIDNETSSVWLKTTAEAPYNITIPAGTSIPVSIFSNTPAFIIYAHNAKGLATNGTLIKFHDYIGNAQLSGPGGNEYFPWYYGQPPDSNTEPEEFTVLRDKISIHRSELQGGLCIFDNGLVSIIDMGYTVDEAWEAGKGRGPDAQANEANDSLFPIYQAPCAVNPVNTHRWVGDRAEDTDDGIEYVRTYSTINDAMFYGTIVYDTFVKYLGEPPLNEKLRLRLHYRSLGSSHAYWDGAYATFADGYPYQYSTSSLDAIGHEIGHGVLNRLMEVDFFQPSIEFSKAFRTLHEAFGDISGVMAWYEYGELKGEDQSASVGATHFWRHGQENTAGISGQTRKLNQIVTEYEAIETLLDYDETNPNYYLSIGMFTYPFYLLSQQWGLEATYRLYIDAAKNCWTATMSHTQIAQCLKQRAERLVNVPNDASIDILPNNQQVDDVVAAFKTVKIQLFDEGVLSHYNFEKSKLRTQFTDDSRSTSQITQWHWDFGDDATSELEDPQHTYAASGDYQVTLTVVNDVYVIDEESSSQSNMNHKDELTRTISVSDQYCYITTGLTPENDIGQVILNAVDMNFNPEISDYRDAAPIQLTGVNNRTLNLDISGANNDPVAKSIKWTVWLDINDDGFYTSDEIVNTEIIAAGQPYGINISEDLTDFISVANVATGNARFIRVVGENSYSDACSSAAGEAFDVRVIW